MINCLYNLDSMGYICHSQGCTVMFALLSSKPTYSQFIDDFIALSPVVFASNTYGIPLRPLSPLHPILRLDFKLFLLLICLLFQ
jgi:hypothetical protein